MDGLGRWGEEEEGGGGRGRKGGRGRWGLYSKDGCSISEHYLTHVCVIVSV